VPLVLVVVIAVGGVHGFTAVGRFGSDLYVADSVNDDAIVRFNPKRVLHEVFGPPGTVADINYFG
jgi:hypothetical protein